MEFFEQMKRNQRGIERLVIIVYSGYCIGLCVGIFRKGGDAWIPFVMLAALSVSWLVHITRYRNPRIRAIFTTAMMQLSIIIYALNTDDILAVVPIFMALVILAAIYGYTDPLWVTFATIVIVGFYYFVIAKKPVTDTGEALRSPLLQIGNVICLEMMLNIWLKKRLEQTEQTHKMIEALMDAEQSKDDFLANVSHEIRTPVNTICGMSEMALREEDVKKMREEIFGIRDAGNNLMALVSNILDFSQLQNGNVNLEEEAYGITSTLNDIINMAMARKGEKPIELIVDCDADIPSELLGDEKKIRRVILNLVDNAVKFTNEGGIVIKVSARRESYGVNLSLEIKDTGIGIREDNLEKLFESFSQVDTRRNRQEGGVGLGLAISKELVQKMGGTITVKSRIGKGSSFRFVVPQKVLDDTPIGQVADREKLNVAAYFDMGQFDVMEIRDAYSALIMHMVRQLQVKCHVCRNLEELKRRMEIDPFTHIFISLEEYQEDELYFEELAKQVRVAIVVERYNEKYISGTDILRLYKPFSILPVVSILNGKKGSTGGIQLVRESKFVAPEAHILVVDDNRMNIRVIEGMLKEYQIKVTSATSGQEALEVIERMSYDFVFMDHMMPEMDGIEAMHRIRNKIGHYYQKVPIIALTANAAPGNREKFLEEGFTDFIAKPVELSVLERVLRRNLPEEKLIFLAGKEGGKGAAHPEDDKLVIGDLKVEKGLLYCGGRQQYLEILQALYEESDDERKQIDELYTQKDWKNYTIKVHALKSMMQNIGAEPLFEMARDLESAGKKNDADYISRHHEDMLVEHRRVMEEIRSCPLIQITEEVETQFGPEDLPPLAEERFDELISELEDAMFGLDDVRMMEVLSEMQRHSYLGVSLHEKLMPVVKKVQMSDYMSAVDTVTRIRREIEDQNKGGAAFA